MNAFGQPLGMVAPGFATATAVATPVTATAYNPAASGVQPAQPFAASAPPAAFGQAMPAAFGASASGGGDLGAQITKLGAPPDQGLVSLDCRVHAGKGSSSSAQCRVSGRAVSGGMAVNMQNCDSQYFILLDKGF